MRLLSSIDHFKSLDILLRIGLFLAVVTIFSILSNMGASKNKEANNILKDPASSNTNTTAYCYHPTSTHPDSSHQANLPQIEAAELAKEQAARAEHEAKQNAAKALIVKHQRRKVRQLDTKQKVEKVGMLVGVIVVGTGGWWWFAEVLRAVVV